MVDDEQDMCNSLCDFLKKDDHNVKCVNNGKVSIELLKNNDFDILTCDLVMPEVTGMDIVRSLDMLDKRPKVGIITAWKHKFKNVTDKSLNVDFIIRKPFELSELRKEINNLGL